MGAQYDASVLKIDLGTAAEAFEDALYSLSAKAKLANKHFDQRAFNEAAFELIAALREDMESYIVAADEALANSERASSGLEPGEYRIVPSIDPHFLAAE